MPERVRRDRYEAPCGGLPKLLLFEEFEHFACDPPYDLKDTCEETDPGGKRHFTAYMGVRTAHSLGTG